MTEVVIAGIGQVPVGEHWDASLRSLGTRAVLAALHDFAGLKPQAMYIGNMLASVVSHQANLGALLAENIGLDGIEAYTVEAAGASGAGAFHLGYLAVASGFVDTAVVLGVEKYTDMVGSELESAVAQSTDYDYEAVQGVTPTSLAALLMQRYMYEYKAPRQAFAEIPLLAHANAVNNPNAMYRKPISREAYNRAELISDPLNLYDMAAYADGAAAVVLTRPELVPAGLPQPLVRIVGSSVVVDSLSLHDRRDPLLFEAVTASTERACRQAGILPGDVDLFELCDAFSIYALLSLEAAGFAKRGQGWLLAQSGELCPGGKLPVMTMGGLKGRGNPLGASGVYQVVEAVTQLRGLAGKAQIPNARLAMVQSLGGPASTAITHVLERL
ncbi:MAG TPA: thiolase domain-containing protein [Anaerolineaceae bacterium]|nr:thiolase domain-containing protein [Anaerolineaceae bacterium]